jgi:hypothetical protein
MPHTRLFQFNVGADSAALRALPKDIRAVVSVDPTGYPFDFVVGALAEDAQLHYTEDEDWARVPDVSGIMNFPLSTVERSHFWIGVSVLPNSKGDPKDAAWKPLIRASGMHTDDFASLKAAAWPELVKKFPHGVFSLRVNLVPLFAPVVVPGSTTFEAQLAQAKIRSEDIVYDNSIAITDASGKVLATNHNVVYWSDDLQLSGTKYVP